MFSKRLHFFLVVLLVCMVPCVAWGRSNSKVTLLSLGTPVFDIEISQTTVGECLFDEVAAEEGVGSRLDNQRDDDNSSEGHHGNHGLLLAVN